MKRGVLVWIFEISYLLVDKISSLSINSCTLPFNLTWSEFRNKSVLSFLGLTNLDWHPTTSKKFSKLIPNKNVGDNKLSHTPILNEYTPKSADKALELLASKVAVSAEERKIVETPEKADLPF